MPIRVTCDECDKQLALDDRFAGKRVKCPKCKGPIDVPADEDERDDRVADRKRSRPRDEEDDRPRSRKAARDDDEDDRPRKRRDPDEDDDRPRKRRDSDEDDRPRKRRDPDEDEGEPRPKKSKKKQGKGGGMVLWLLLAGGGVFVLGGAAVAALWLLGVFGGSIGSEMKYFPDGVESVSSSRTDQMRKTRYHEAMKAKLGGLGISGTNLYGVKDEDVERSTTARGGSEIVTIITAKKSLKPEEIKEGMKVPGFGKSDFTEEKVGGYVLYVGKGPTGAQAFCIPESRILVVGKADTLRQILKRDKKPDLPAAFSKAYADADFSNSQVTVSGSTKGLGGGLMGLKSGRPEASVMQSDFGSSVSRKIILYYGDSNAAEEARKEAEESLKKEPIISTEAAKESRKNARISKSGSTLTISTSVREQTLIDKLNGKR